MTKIQNDFYFKWAKDRIQATYSTNQTLNSLIEYVNVDTSTNTVQIELPDTSGSEIENSKKIHIIDQGTASTNNITIIPNIADGTTIEGESSLVVSNDNAIVILELVNNQWVIIRDTQPNALASYNMVENTNVTIISGTSVATDINGTAIASSVIEGFTFSTSPNEIENTSGKQLKCLVSCTASIQRQSGAARRDIALLLQQDSGGGYVQVPNATAEIGVGNFPEAVAFSKVLILEPNDKIKLMVENRQNTNDLIITDMSLVITEV